MNIAELLSNRANYGAVRDLSSIRYIVVHYTANDGDSSMGNASYFAKNVVKASAHYFVDSRSITRSVPENCVAYHCGADVYRHPNCRNGNSIGVELCDDNRNGKYDFSEAELSLAAELIRDLMARYHIPPENVIRHYDVTGKLCPAPFAKNESAWQAFKQRLSPQQPDLTPEKEDQMVIYKTLADVPAWARPTVEKLMVRGLLQGEGADLNLEHNSLRVLVINDRAGLYR